MSEIPAEYSSHRPDAPLISVVTPCYNEQENIEDCYHAVRRVFEQQIPDCRREHVFCDNASTDRSIAILRQLAAADPAVKVVLNARNFGPLRSTYNGVMRTRGDAVLVLLPADLQDPPELLAEFVEHWRQGNDVVYGIRAKRDENLAMRLMRKCYYQLVKWISNIEIPMNVGSFQLIDRQVVDVLRSFGDHHPHLPNMIASCGFQTHGIPYQWSVRQKGNAKNRLHHLFNEALNSLISFSIVPLRLCIIVGLILAGFSFLRAGYTIGYTLLFGTAAPRGIATVITALFFFSGIQLFFLGILGEYIGAIHAQVRARPRVIERELINFGPSTSRHAPPPSDASTP